MYFSVIENDYVDNMIICYIENNNEPYIFISERYFNRNYRDDIKDVFNLNFKFLDSHDLSSTVMLLVDKKNYNLLEGVVNSKTGYYFVGTFFKWKSKLDFEGFKNLLMNSKFSKNIIRTEERKIYLITDIDMMPECMNNYQVLLKVNTNEEDNPYLLFNARCNCEYKIGFIYDGSADDMRLLLSTSKIYRDRDSLIKGVQKVVESNERFKSFEVLNTIKNFNDINEIYYGINCYEKGKEISHSIKRHHKRCVTNGELTNDTLIDYTGRMSFRNATYVNTPVTGRTRAIGFSPDAVVEAVEVSPINEGTTI